MKSTVLLLLALFLFNSCLQRQLAQNSTVSPEALDAEISEKRKRIKKLDDELEKLKKDVDDLEDKEDELDEEEEELDEREEELEERIEELERTPSATRQKELEKAKNDLEAVRNRQAEIQRERDEARREREEARREREALRERYNERLIDDLEEATGKETTSHSGSCPRTLYTGTARNLDNKLREVTFDLGNFEDDNFFIRRILVKNAGVTSVHFKKSTLEDFADDTWFLYFEDHNARDASNHQEGNIQYKAIQFKASDSERVDADSIIKFIDKPIDEHVLEYIANVDSQRGRHLSGTGFRVNIYFAIQTDTQCIEVHE